MIEPVTKWNAPRGTTISEAENGEFVLTADYESLEQELHVLNDVCCTLEEELEDIKRSWGLLLIERNAALKQVNGLKVERTDLLDRNVELRCLLTKQTKRTDEARELLAQCQEHLDPHRDAVLWGDVVEALRAKT